ncbi:hypothetical protein C0J52_23316 [Blattella germanica]|nr:hypothetical protein C0J52_23316 [Blattella germanica]
MLKSMLQFHENTDISRFGRLILFLKKKSIGYQPQQSKTFSRDEINRFMREASDKEHLLTKVIVLFRNK